MEMKWLMVAWATIMTAMFVGMGFEAYTKSECRTAYVQSNKSADEINKICK